MEEQSDQFQLMRDGLDLKILTESNSFTFLPKITEPLLIDPKTIYDTSRKMNKDVLESLHKTTKLSKAQISRVFDIALYLAVDISDKSAGLAFEGFLKKKLERTYSQLLFSRMREKYIEYEGKIEYIDYKKFVTNSAENSKKFDQLFDFNFEQYKAVAESRRKQLKSSNMSQ